MLYEKGPGGTKLIYEQGKDKADWNYSYLTYWQKSQEGPQFWINVVIDFLSQKGFEVAPKGRGNVKPQGDL